MYIETSYRLEDYFDLPNPRLNGYFNTVINGQHEDYRTPFFGGAKVKRSVVLDKWANILFNSRLDNIVPGLIQFEKDMLAKVGPMSLMKPLSQRWDDIFSYFHNGSDISPINDQAIKLTIKEFSSVKVQERNIHETLKFMKLSTSSGAPFYMKKRNAIEQTLHLSHFDYYHDKRIPAILGWRGQEGGPEDTDVKNRVVWMFPFSVTIKELQMYQPLILAWQRNNINPCYVSDDAVAMRITKCFDTKPAQQLVIATDFKQFDQHFNISLQSAARQIVSSMCINGDAWFRDVFNIKYDIPLLCGKTIIHGRHGMGSGSGGTNFDECCAHRSLQYECALAHNSKLNPFSCSYGDDGYLTFNGITVDKVISSYTKHGLVMQSQKQHVSSNSTVFLRKYYHTNYRGSGGVMLGVYSSFRALGRLLGQERRWNHWKQMDYGLYSILRAWSILENCKNHPLFENLVDFVISGDKYKLGLSYPKFFDIVFDKFKELIELDPNALGYTKMLQMNSDLSGIKSWRIYKYLSSKI